MGIPEINSSLSTNMPCPALPDPTRTALHNPLRYSYPYSYLTLHF